VVTHPVISLGLSHLTSTLCLLGFLEVGSWMAINRRTLGTANNTAIRITLKTFYLNNTAPSAIVTGLNSSAKICGCRFPTLAP
jgi:hypothetical protein